MRLLLLTLFLAACGGDGAPPVLKIVGFSRGASANEFIATIDGPATTISAEGATVGPLVELNDGTLQATIACDGSDREVVVTASDGSREVKRTALLFSYIDASWDQPEAIEGLVNTAGVEDGASVSADGEWLLVSSYIPLDMYSCHFGGADPAAPACNTILGPYAAPERPGMLGAERIASPTRVVDACPSLGLLGDGEEDLPFAVPPTAAFGFRRQADGSYAEPFVIGFGVDGCIAPFGLSFVAETSEVVFAWDDPRDAGGGDSGPDLYWSPLTLGQPNLLAQYALVSNAIVANDFVPELLLSLPAQQGNPVFSNGQLFWDDEGVAESERQLFVASVSGALANASLGPVEIAAASQDGLEEIQPFLDGSTLYFMRGGALWSATGASAAAPVLSAGDNAQNPGTVLAVGEPSIARIDGEEWLYFVYVKKTATGLDANVGRVRKL